MVSIQWREINHGLLESYINASLYILYHLLNSVYFYTKAELPILILLPSPLPIVLEN